MVVQMCKVCTYRTFTLLRLLTLISQNPVVKQYDLSSVRFMMCSAAPLSAELTQQLIELLPQIEIHQGYGRSRRTPSFRKLVN